MITVAHRLYTIQQADKILYMENGVLVDSGRHDELLERLPQYAEMVDVERKGGIILNELAVLSKAMIQERKDIILSILGGFIAGIAGVALFLRAGI